MTVKTRRQQILGLIREVGDIGVEDLSVRFGVSEATIRRDLRYLSEKNLVQRSRGGVSSNFPSALELPILSRAQMNREEKKIIGDVAARLVEDRDTIFLSGGTTTSEVARNLTNKLGITVVTCAINIINHLVNHPEITVIVPGGTLIHKHLTLVGEIGNYTLERLRIDKAFMGVSAIDVEQGITSESLEDAETDRKIINIARKLIVVTDSSKFGIVRTALVAPIERIDYLITDTRVSPGEVESIRSRGVEVILA